MGGKEKEKFRPPTLEEEAKLLEDLMIKAAVEEFGAEIRVGDKVSGKQSGESSGDSD